MKTYYLLFVLLLCMLWPAGCTREEADTSLAEKLAEETSKIPYIYTSSGTRQLVEPGKLTAGEWNDLDNWHLWTPQLKNGQGRLMQEKWKIASQYRYTVVLRDSLQQRIPDAHVFLETVQGTLLDESRTDNSGLCYLFPAAIAKQEDLRLKIVYADQVFYTGDLNPQYRVLQKQLNIHRQLSPVVDILWVAGTGPSAAKELQPLQATLHKAITEVKSRFASELKIRSGSVGFPEYTDTSANSRESFTNQINSGLTCLSEQPLPGEASSLEVVYQALEEAVNRTDWSKQATSRLLFLVVNNAMHGNPDLYNRLAGVSRQAARQGIRIIPMVTGRINAQSELLLRSLAVRTNGTYLFLTHQAAGNFHHPETDIGPYIEEPLENLIARLIVNASELK